MTDAGFAIDAVATALGAELATGSVRDAPLAALTIVVRRRTRDFDVAVDVAVVDASWCSVPLGDDDAEAGVDAGRDALDVDVDNAVVAVAAVVDVVAVVAVIVVDAVDAVDAVVAVVAVVVVVDVVVVDVIDEL